MEKFEGLILQTLIVITMISREIIQSEPHNLELLLGEMDVQISIDQESSLVLK